MPVKRLRCTIRGIEVELVGSVGSSSRKNITVHPLFQHQPASNVDAP